MMTEMKVVFGCSMRTARRYIGIYNILFYAVVFTYVYIYIVCTDGETYHRIRQVRVT